jgi:hypothetical protein
MSEVSDNVTEFPTRDLIAEMKGPPTSGHAVFVDGYVIPHIMMVDNGETIDFIIDNRMSFSFPREHAYQAANFAAVAMAVAAGHNYLSEPHNITKPFAVKAVKLDGLPK